MLDDIRFSTTSGDLNYANAKGTVNAKASDYGNNISTELTMEMSTYNNPQVGSHRCVNLKRGSTIFGRIDINSAYTDGQASGRSEVVVVYEENTRHAAPYYNGQWTGNANIVDVGPLIDAAYERGKGTINVTGATQSTTRQGLANALGCYTTDLRQIFSSYTMKASGYYGFKVTCGAADEHFYYFYIG
jgi:hypothetical protein